MSGSNFKTLEDAQKAAGQHHRKQEAGSPSMAPDDGWVEGPSKKKKKSGGKKPGGKKGGKYSSRSHPTNKTWRTTGEFHTERTVNTEHGTYKYDTKKKTLRHFKDEYDTTGKGVTPRGTLARGPRRHKFDSLEEAQQAAGLHYDSVAEGTPAKKRGGKTRRSSVNPLQAAVLNVAEV